MPGCHIGYITACGDLNSFSKSTFSSLSKFNSSYSDKQTFISKYSSKPTPSQIEYTYYTHYIQEGHIIMLNYLFPIFNEKKSKLKFSNLSIKFANLHTVSYNR